MKSISNQQWRAEYISRMNRVIDYIDKHLDQDLSMQVLSEIANFSRCHFHRIFVTMVGETLNQYIRRLRIEKGAIMVCINPHKPITEVAFDCGFSSCAIFSRIFKEFYGMSVNEWLKKKHRNNCETKSKMS